MYFKKTKNIFYNFFLLCIVACGVIDGQAFSGKPKHEKRKHSVSKNPLSRIKKLAIKCKDVVEEGVDWCVYSGKVFKLFIKHNGTVGAITESSPFLVREITRSVQWLVKNSERPIKVLEIGSGPGCVSKHIAKLLRPCDRLDVVEVLLPFFEMTVDRVSPVIADESNGGCKNIYFYLSPFEDWKKPTGIRKYDVVITTVPYTQIPPEVSRQHLEIIPKLLKKGGFLTHIKYVFADEYSKRRLTEKELAEYLVKRDFFENWVLEKFDPVKWVKKVMVSMGEFDDGQLVRANFPSSYVIHGRKK
ncbi:hypothetical protein HOD08_02520 [bacterium]|nr:hypothetical protein [bacterium]